MVVLISYQSQLGEREELEWVTDGDGSWTVESIVKCFRRRYPTATFLSCLQLSQPLHCSA